MLDLCYEEDSQADVDMNVVMTGAGKFVEVQATAEHTPFDDAQMARPDRARARRHRPTRRDPEEGHRRLTTLYCATGNAGKLREFRMAAGAAPFEIELLPDFKILPPCVEDGATFEENAIIKALPLRPSRATACCLPTIPALEVDALGGAPGVYSARFSGPDATDAANNRLLLEKLRGVANRAARFVCAIALVEGERSARRLSRSRSKA